MEHVLFQAEASFLNFMIKYIAIQFILQWQIIHLPQLVIR